MNKGDHKRHVLGPMGDQNSYAVRLSNRIVINYVAWIAF